MSVPLIGRLLDLLPDDAWTESRHRRPHPRTEDPATRPVVLIHGAVGSRSNFTGIVTALRGTASTDTAAPAPARPVLSISYGHHGTAPLHESFTEVREKLAGITADAGPVDLVGHSQGGLIALAASGTPELHQKIIRVIGLAGNFRGVQCPPVRGIPIPLPVPALRDNLVGSRAFSDLMDYARRSTVPLTQILSATDRIVPADRARAFLTDDAVSGIPAHRGPGQVLAVEGIAHSKMPYSHQVGRLVAEVLNNSGTFTR